MMGYLFQRRKNGKTLETWWMKYYVNGRPVRVSTGTSKKKAAQRILDDREGRAARGEALLPRADRVRWERTWTDRGVANLLEAACVMCHAADRGEGRTA